MSKRKRQTIRKGLRRNGNKLEAFRRVNGVLYVQPFDLGTPDETIDNWLAQIKRDHFGGGAAINRRVGLAADLEIYKPLIAAKPTARQIVAHLEAWIAELGRDRSRHSVTTEEIDAIINRWLIKAPASAVSSRRRRGPGLDKQTIRKYRNSLRTFYNVLNRTVKGATNPVQKAINFTPPKPEARGTDYATLGAVLAAMPDYHSHKAGTAPTAVNLSKLRAAVLFSTGIPPGMLAAVPELDLTAAPATYRVEARLKGGGVEARTIPLTPAGRAAFAALEAAGGLIPFQVGPLNVSIKRAARRIGALKGTFTRQYDARHSFGAQMYRTTGDQATVARMMIHAAGSPTTARYTLTAHEEVDRAAAAAFAASIAHIPTPALAAPLPVTSPVTGPKLVPRVGKRPKLRAVK